MTRPDRAPSVALHLATAGWDDVLDALGVAAERTSHDIDCDICAGELSCELHDGDWERVARWRALATNLRQQLTTGVPTPVAADPPAGPARP